MQFFRFPIVIISSCLLFAGCTNSTYSRPPVVEDATKLKSYSSGSAAGQQYYIRKTNRSTAAAGSLSSGNAYSSSDNAYTVVKGDTLYSVAFRYGQDYKSLAKLNNIEAPYDIKVGQVLRLNSSIDAAPIESVSKTTPSPAYYTVKAGDTATSVALRHGMTLSELVDVNKLKKPYSLYTGQRLKVSSEASQVPVAGQSSASTSSQASASLSHSEPIKVVTGKTRTVGGLTWMWPAKGKVVQGFSASEHGNKGVDIAGSRGQDIYAASAGQVVYSGSALRGYGNLVIINHNNEYLSAYAHNERLLVKEGQKVKRGQVIAKMGNTDAKQVMLHFEIRYKGNSVNPQKYLP